MALLCMQENELNGVVRFSFCMCLLIMFNCRKSCFWWRQPTQRVTSLTCPRLDACAPLVVLLLWSLLLLMPHSAEQFHSWLKLATVFAVFAVVSAADIFLMRVEITGDELVYRDIFTLGRLRERRIQIAEICKLKRNSSGTRCSITDAHGKGFRFWHDPPCTDAFIMEIRRAGKALGNSFFISHNAEPNTVEENNAPAPLVLEYAALVERMEKCFSSEPFPISYSVISSGIGDAYLMDAAEAFMGKSWREVEFDALARHRIAPSILSKEAFICFLPAYLKAMLENLAGMRASVAFIVSLLVPWRGTFATPFTDNRLDWFSAEQRDIIRNVLTALKDAHPSDPSDFFNIADTVIAGIDSAAPRRK